MKNKTPIMSAAEWNARQAPAKVKPEKKVQSGEEQMDLTSSEVSKLIDSIILTVPEYVEYREERIECRYKGCQVVITFKINKP